MRLRKPDTTDAMHQQKQYPHIDNWYMNLTGKLFKVNMVVYRGNDIAKVVIEDSQGFKTTVNRYDWDCLKLIRHTAASMPGQLRVIN